MNRLVFGCFLILSIFVQSCSSGKSATAESLFLLKSPEDTGFDFFNKVENGKQMNIFKYRNFYNGGGVAIGDVNNDGLPDIFMTANMGSNKLFLNKGDFKFDDISKSAGVEGNKPWSTGVVMVDINQDGLLDIYVSNAGNLEGNNHENDLFINNGDLTFTERAKDFNLAKSGFTTHASFFDYDKDGDLDAYILNNSNIPISTLGYANQREVRAENWDISSSFRGVGDLLLRNDDGYFTDVSEESGIYGSLIGFGLGVYVTDINNDLYPDIYVSNDFYERDYLYINNQDGTFTEDIMNWTSHLCLSAMGVDMGDINNDGLNDIFITDMLPEENERVKSVMEFDNQNIFELKQSRDFHQQYIQNTLQLNNGNGSFSEIAYFSGVAKTDWSWAGLIFDMNNDGYKDIFVTNGLNHDLTDLDFVSFFADEIIQKMVLTGEKEEVTDIINKMPSTKIPNYAFMNNGNLQFSNVSESWGLDTPSFSNGCAYGDLDNDGDIDLVVNNVNMPSFLYENRSDQLTQNNYLKFRLEGSNSNRNGIGSVVMAHSGSEVFSLEMMPSRGFQSSMDYSLVMGLGKVDMLDSIRIIWPDGRTELMKKCSVNQTITFSYTDSLSLYKPRRSEKATLLKEMANVELESHEENPFNDFDQEGMISQKISKEGPALAVGDVNGDGNEDVFLGGAKDQPAIIYMNKGSGNLTSSNQPDFERDKSFEDTSASFFDCDGDGDLDLMVGSGGNEASDAVNYYARLYINEGGIFSASSQNILGSGHNIGVIAPYDFDNDGDVDVFVGGRSVPSVYGVSPSHKLLVNDGHGVFSDGTERYGYDLSHAGMITDAIWVDMTGDDLKDLVVVTDWGSPKIFVNNTRRLSLQSNSLDELNGWWNTIEASDIDKDGDLDLILGNNGSNIPFKVSAENPTKLWVNDFDNNGTIEQVFTIHENGGDYPIHMKREITMQMSSLKKKNLKASEYAKRTIQELFSAEMIESSIVRSVNTMESVIAVNEGDGIFRIKELPTMVQLSCVCDILCEDVNRDGNIDIITGGNNFGFKPQFSRLDGNYGSVMLGDGSMQFEWQNYDQSGFFIRDEVRHLSVFKDASGRQYVFAAINDQKPKVFQLNK